MKTQSTTEPEWVSPAKLVGSIVVLHAAFAAFALGVVNFEDVPRADKKYMALVLCALGYVTGRIAEYQARLIMAWGAKDGPSR
tara:strand:- start:60 stop:308 length:249 start_codon:yes stop_codon:yes gene_type:complete